MEHKSVPQPAIPEESAWVSKIPMIDKDSQE